MNSSAGSGSARLRKRRKLVAMRSISFWRAAGMAMGHRKGADYTGASSSSPACQPFRTLDQTADQAIQRPAVAWC